MINDNDLLALLTATLQKECVKDKGDLELRLGRPWTPAAIPDEPLSVKILDLPATGVTSSFILRFELRTARATVGTWQLALQARIWRDVWIARSALKRGELAAEADLDRDRRDILTLREPLAEFSSGDTSLELAEALQAGSPVFARSVKARPVIHRGQAADALVQDGALSITMKVEALEDGAPGQIIRVRNAQSRRDIRGKVLNEQTILIPL
jgi:flagella basal body P-ring formation protein FlgA